MNKRAFTATMAARVQTVQEWMERTEGTDDPELLKKAHRVTSTAGKNILDNVTRIALPRATGATVDMWVEVAQGGRKLHKLDMLDMGNEEARTALNALLRTINHNLLILSN